VIIDFTPCNGIFLFPLKTEFPAAENSLQSRETQVHYTIESFFPPRFFNNLCKQEIQKFRRMIREMDQGEQDSLLPNAFWKIVRNHHATRHRTIRTDTSFFIFFSPIFLLYPIPSGSIHSLRAAWLLLHCRPPHFDTSAIDAWQ